MSVITWPGGREWPEVIQRAEALGIYLAWRDNEPDFDVEGFQAIVDQYTLDEAKAWLSVQCKARAKELRDMVVADVSPGEMASWAIKRQEALAFNTTGNPASAPMLSGEATVRGCSLAEVVARVSANATKYALAEIQISGADGKHRDAIGAISDWVGAGSYDFSVGWPVVA